MTEQQQPDTPAARKRTTKGGEAALWFAIVVFVLTVGGCAISLVTGGPSDAELRETDAELACQSWVRDRLRAPSTAEFVNVYTRTGQADLTEEDVYAGRSEDDVYTVRGSVDAQNGFGAMVREAFVCEVRDTGDGWELLGIDMD
jgi:hypothetical protein